MTSYGKYYFPIEILLPFLNSPLIIVVGVSIGVVVVGIVVGASVGVIVVGIVVKFKQSKGQK